MIENGAVVYYEDVEPWFSDWMVGQTELELARWAERKMVPLGPVLEMARLARERLANG